MKTVKNPKVNIDKILITYQYRVKDSNKKPGQRMPTEGIPVSLGLIPKTYIVCKKVWQNSIKSKV